MRNILLFIVSMVTHLSLAQDTTITGSVVDTQNGQPVPFVNIINKSTNSGSTSDFDGNFTVKASKGDILEFSYVGYITKSITIGESTTLQVRIEEDVAELESVVVIGYGTQRKKEVTGSVAIVGDDIVQELQPQVASEALRGTVAGVEVTQQGVIPELDLILRLEECPLTEITFQMFMWMEL